MKYGNISSNDVHIRKEIADIKSNSYDVVNSCLFKILFPLTE